VGTNISDGGGGAIVVVGGGGGGGTKVVVLGATRPRPTQRTWPMVRSQLGSSEVGFHAYKSISVIPNFVQIE
jgi:hypothetical protein